MNKGRFIVRAFCITFVFIMGWSVIAYASDEIKINPSIQKDNPKYVKLLGQGMEVLYEKKPKLAVKEYLNPIVKYCSDKYRDSKVTVYSARSLEESMFYLLKDVADNLDNKNNREGAIVIGPLCAEANYLQGYALLELGLAEDGREYIEKALKLSPVNPLYLSELGHIYQTKKNWQKALELFREAEEHTEAFSPVNKRKLERMRAKRGVGFSLIELGRLDEAEVKFRECLEIDKNDHTSLSELKYIQQLRQKAR